MGVSNRKTYLGYPNIDSLTTTQANICLGDSTEKDVVLELFDPEHPVDIHDQEETFGEIVWKTQADPGYSIKEITDRIISNDCLSYRDFASQW